MIIAFNIHYTDGTTFSDVDGTWDDAPNTNVAAIEVWHDIYTADNLNLRHIWFGAKNYKLPGYKSVKVAAATDKPGVRRLQSDFGHVLQKEYAFPPSARLKTANKDGENDHVVPGVRMAGS